MVMMNHNYTPLSMADNQSMTDGPSMKQDSHTIAMRPPEMIYVEEKTINGVDNGNFNVLKRDAETGSADVSSVDTTFEKKVQEGNNQYQT